MLGRDLIISLSWRQSKQAVGICGVTQNVLGREEMESQ